MAKSRKDNKGRVLRKGETVRSSSGMYQYAYMDAFGKRQFIYANDLLKLRQKEVKIGYDIFNSMLTIMYMMRNATKNSMTVAVQRVRD